MAQGPSLDEFRRSASLPLPEDPAAVLAVVGNSPILLGDIKPRVDVRLEQVLAKTKQKVPKDELRYARLRMTRGLLTQMIRDRVMREAFLLDQVATETAEKRREADETMQSKARQMFFEDELPNLMKKMDAADAGELDRKLGEAGSSLMAKQNEFINAMLGHLYIRSKINQDPPISLAEIREYYHSNRSDFEREARATWEQLTVRFENFSDQDAAYQAIWEMGREAFFGGSMQAVARAKSQEPFADTGGLHDWTNQGSLASNILDEQIFSLPTDAMSQIIKDQDAFHIVRVLDRTSAGVQPMAEVQDKIREILRKQKIEAAQRDLMEEVRSRVTVWSLYPDDIPGAQPLSLPESIASASSGATPR
ncbi:MAG: peptidylprolyl isomerase [Planctomycetota bacterium]